tara:strand:+ start:6250 stop:6510 length:261 start_codon:yes stop_codon:yes gene_type:complete
LIERIEQLEQNMGVLSSQLSLMHAKLIDLSVMTNALLTLLMDKDVFSPPEIQFAAETHKTEMQKMMAAAEPDNEKIERALKNIDIK